MGPSAGLKLFVSDQTFVNIGYRYSWFFNSFEAARDNRTHGNHVANIGLGFVWGGSGDRTMKMTIAPVCPRYQHKTWFFG
jgi:hypothetical protein